MKEKDSELSFDCGYSEYAKEQHKKRVSKNPERIAYAIKQFKIHGIEYELKNETTGHFHCWKKADHSLIQFYAGTGKIMGYSNLRGIKNLIKICESDTRRKKDE